MKFNNFDFFLLFAVVGFLVLFIGALVKEDTQLFGGSFNFSIQSPHENLDFNLQKGIDHIKVRSYKEIEWAEQMEIENVSEGKIATDGTSIEVGVFHDYDELLAIAEDLTDNDISCYIRVISTIPKVVGLYVGPFISQTNAKKRQEQINSLLKSNEKTKLVPYTSAR